MSNEPSIPGPGILARPLHAVGVHVLPDHAGLPRHHPGRALDGLPDALGGGGLAGVFPLGARPPPRPSSPTTPTGRRRCASATLDLEEAAHEKEIDHELSRTSSARHTAPSTRGWRFETSGREPRLRSRTPSLGAAGVGGCRLRSGSGFFFTGYRDHQANAKRSSFPLADLPSDGPAERSRVSSRSTASTGWGLPTLYKREAAKLKTLNGYGLDRRGGLHPRAHRAGHATPGRQAAGAARAVGGAEEAGRAGWSAR